MWRDRSSEKNVLTEEGPLGPLGLLRMGIMDIEEGLRGWRIWHLIGVSSIRRRYARSRLGQFWLTLSTAIFVLMYGTLFSVLFKRDPAEFMPYVCTSIILWSIISGTISNATTCLVGAHRYFQNQYASFSIAIFVVIYRELITIAHEIWIILGILLYFGLILNIDVPRLALGIVLVLFTLVWMSYAIAIICVRFRDVIQITASVMRAAFFLTPIFWHESMFPEAYRKYLILNPFNVLLSVIRDPLLGSPAPPHYLLYGSVGSILGFFATMILVGKYRRRIIFWI
jgi:ABC-type polysaccharide/polyol phosphate export permease